MHGIWATREGLKWSRESNRLWALWGRSLAKAGAFEAAEFVYWDALRRFSWNAAIRSLLIQVLKREPARFDEALRVAEESFELFPDNKAITVQLAMLLSGAAKDDNISKALDILSARMQSADKIDYEISALASILADAQAAGLLKEPDLKKVVQRLRERPRILGGVSGFLIDHQKAFNVAQRLWHLRAADAPDNAISRSQLAGGDR